MSPAEAKIRTWLHDLACTSVPPIIVTDATAVVGPRTGDLPASDRVALELLTVAVDHLGVVTITARVATVPHAQPYPRPPAPPAPIALEPPGMPYFCGALACGWSGTAADAATASGYRCPTCGARAEPVF